MSTSESPIIRRVAPCAGLRSRPGRVFCGPALLALFGLPAVAGAIQPSAPTVRGPNGALAASVSPAPQLRTPAVEPERDLYAAAVAAAQATIPRATYAPLATVDAPAKDSSGAALDRVPRGSQIPVGINAALAVDGEGNPAKSRRSIRIQDHLVRAGETLRVIAYRFCTSPVALAGLNGLRWSAEDDALEPGTRLRVPIHTRVGSAFGQGERLESGPGVRVDRPHHAWGRPYVVRLLRDTFTATGRTWPHRHPLIVHDVSRFGGGRLGKHKSHRAGLDIDVGYPTREAARADWGNPGLDDIDYERLWFVVDRLERSGHVAAIYMSPSIQRRLHAHAVMAGADADRLEVLFQYPASGGKSSKGPLIRNEAGHRDHMHIRFTSFEDLPELAS